jgi:hypothetical protein
VNVPPARRNDNKAVSIGKGLVGLNKLPIPLKASDMKPIEINAVNVSSTNRVK